jgi:tetratricopeptide (TPR) repeat protein
MAIDDPTALPETAQQTTEYLREADLAFEREQLDLALSLYWSVGAAGNFANDENRTHTYVRVGEILMGQGNDAEAYRWLEAAGPAGADLLKIIDARTTDAAVDPEVIPQTPEVLTRYTSAMNAANESKDYATFDQLVNRIMESNATVPAQRASVGLLMAQSLIDRGHDAQAEEWAQAALAEDSGSHADEARKLIEKASANQGMAGMMDDRVTTYGFELTAAIQTFEGGGADKGKAMFESVAADTTGLNDDEAKGRARYYLGMIAYHERDFDVAREHFEFASDYAGSPEIGYAAEALKWRYQEEG